MRRILFAAAAVAMAAWLASPHGLLAVSVPGWSLTASPTSVTAGVTTAVNLRLTDTEQSRVIGCMRMSVPAAFAVSGVAVVATRAGTPWTATHTGAGPTEVRIYNPDGRGKLTRDDWVDFRVTVTGQQAGSHSWLAEVFGDAECGGNPDLEPVSLPMTVAPPPATPPPATPAPTPPPAPSATPAPTPPPAPSATPAPTPPPATPAPTPPPAPSATRTSTSSIPLAAPTPTATSRPDERPPAGSGSGTDAGVPPGPPSNGDGPRSSGQGEGTDRDRNVSSADDRRIAAIHSDEATTHSDLGAPDADLALAFEALGVLGGLESWFVPGLVVGVPGLLVILIVTAHVGLGAAWMPNVGRMLGPAPPDRPTDEHVWWAAGPRTTE